jgi:hypothetical protein
MTREHLERTLRFYLDRWKLHYAPERLDTEDLFPAGDRSKAMKHAMWMAEQALVFIAEKKTEKAFTWLGFVQGTFWACGHYSIDEMRAHSTEATEP